MNAFIIELDNRPGSLADVATAIAEKGINITGVAGATGTTTGSVALLSNDEDATRSALDSLGARYREVALLSTSLEDKPGVLADVARRLANAGVNIEALLPTGMEGGRITLALGVDNLEAAKSVLGQSAGVSA